MARKTKSVAARRPAETASFSVAAALVLALALFDVHVTEESAAAAVAGVGAISAVVTAIVDRVRGA